MTELTEYFTSRDVELLRLCLDVMHTNSVIGMTIQQTKDIDSNMLPTINFCEELSTLIGKIDALKLMKENEKLR